MDDEENEDDNALFGEDNLVDIDSDTPPHLRALAGASQLGDAHALRLALGKLFSSLITFSARFLRFSRSRLSSSILSLSSVRRKWRETKKVGSFLLELILILVPDLGFLCRSSM